VNASFVPVRPPMRAADRPRRALLLDDEHERRTEMREGLADHGVMCDEVATLEEALRRLVVSTYDLVVCDLVLCDPPEAANPALRGYLAVCFALAHSTALVVQASSMRRWAHAGALLTNWRVDEVANVVYGSSGIPARQSVDGGCPWSGLLRLAGAAPGERPSAVSDLARLPIVRELESSLELSPMLAALEDAADGTGDWDAALAGIGGALFPGVGHVR
jgi:hypothetical protein